MPQPDEDEWSEEDQAAAQRLTETPDPEIEANARRLADMVTPKRPQQKRSITRSQFAQWTKEMQAFLKSTEWEHAEPKHFVALHAWCFEEVYKVPCELMAGGKDCLSAVGAAQRCLREFGDDPVEMAAFMRWLWQRESEREKWRRENRKQGSVLLWHYAFTARNASEFRIAKARSHRT